jgi:hypothetical protein
MKSKFIPIILLGVITLIFFKSFVLSGKLPIPADTIIGLYHPFRDLYAKDYPRGIPFKNSLITDPVRQQYPWKKLSIDQIKRGEFPIWNPYSFSGNPLLSNFQSGIFYPLNIVFFLFNFNFSWSLFILLQPFLASVFMYLYLNNLRLDKKASLLGAVTFAFSGFSIAWLEWGNVINTILWTPLILLSIDKFFFSNNRYGIRNKDTLLWSLLLVFSFSSAFFAGHLQSFFYLYIFSGLYFLAKLVLIKKRFFPLIFFALLNLVFLAVTSVQWIPGFQFIMLSARGVDQVDWQKIGWFIPWQNMVQFIAPDFFGNPATLNYWGIWNYGEFIGYVGILSILMAIFAMFFRKDKKTLFFGTLFFISLILAFPSFIATIPFKLNIPFLSTSQPTRLIFISDLTLSILAAFGFDYFIKIRNRKKIIYPLIFFFLVFVFLWGFILYFLKIQPQDVNLLIAKQNLILPTAIFILVSVLILLIAFYIKKGKMLLILLNLLILVLIADLFRFGWKFTPFVDEKYIFPDTKTTLFLQENIGNQRFMTTDPRILPPNFSIMYSLQSAGGYDPLYILNYGEFMASLVRSNPDISYPLNFNRIIDLHGFRFQLQDLLGVKYVLSLEDINDPKLFEVFREGQTRVYENKNVLPRAFFASKVYSAKNKQDSVNMLFKYLEKNELRNYAVIEDFNNAVVKEDTSAGLSIPKILKYEDNYVLIETDNKSDGFMVLTDNYYPTWHAKIDGKEVKIYKADVSFRGILVPAGKHSIVFYNTLF